MVLIHMKKCSLKYAALLLALLGPVGVCEASLGSAQQDGSNTILLQGFHWNSSAYSRNWYNTMAQKVSVISALHVTHVWFPPASDSTSKNGYLPRQLNLLDSYYGTESQLKSAVAAFKAVGINSVADVVINHRVGTTGWGDFTNPTWGTDSITSDDEWGKGTGKADTGAGYESGRDLDHTNATVQSGITAWIKNRLFADVGFRGIRYDYAKGYAPTYAGQYARATAPDFCVGELWENLDYSNVDANRQKLMDYVDGTGGVCGAFDFTTKGLLNKALQNNTYGVLASSSKPAGGIGWWPAKMVTFVDNHDTGPAETCDSGQNTWPVPCASVMQGYAYILTHPGVPTLFWPHLFDWGLYDQIKTLADIRHSQNITSTSKVSIQAAQTGLYAAIIDGKTAMKIGPNSWSPSGSWTLAASGVNYAVWTLKQ